MTRSRPDALLIFVTPITTAYRPIIVEFAIKQRLPTMFGGKADVEAGGLMSYSANLADKFRRAAHYVDRILKGAKAGALRTWLDSWAGIGHVTVGMARQGFDRQLTRYDEKGWRGYDFSPRRSSFQSV